MNRSGQENGFEWPGGQLQYVIEFQGLSSVVGPDGKPIVQAGKTEELLFATVRVNDTKYQSKFQQTSYFQSRY